MNPITIGAKIGKTISTTKFDCLTYSQDGLILNYRNGKQIEIPFEKLDKVYIKKYRLNPFVEFLCISFPFLLVLMSMEYLTFSLMILLSIIFILPVLKIVINYKWYRFNVQLKDGTFYSKRVSVDKKKENIITLDEIQRKYLHYNKSLMTLE